MSFLLTPQSCARRSSAGAPSPLVLQPSRRRRQQRQLGAVGVVLQGVEVEPGQAFPSRQIAIGCGSGRAGARRRGRRTRQFHGHFDR